MGEHERDRGGHERDDRGRSDDPRQPLPGKRSMTQELDGEHGSNLVQALERHLVVGACGIDQPTTAVWPAPPSLATVQLTFR
jgi:hypothetical protein